MSESKTACPICGRGPGQYHAQTCPRHGPNRQHVRDAQGRKPSEVFKPTPPISLRELFL